MSAFRHIGEDDKDPYHYTECGLEDVYLMSGYEIREYDGEKGVAIKHVDELHRAIGRALVMEKKVLTGKELRFLRNEMDLTQSDLGRLLRVSDQSVARWEKEQCEISGSADSLLRFIYLEHINERINALEMVESLITMDAPEHQRLMFKPTKDGWRHCA